MTCQEGICGSVDFFIFFKTKKTSASSAGRNSSYSSASKRIHHDSFRGTVTFDHLRQEGNGLLTSSDWVAINISNQFISNWVWKGFPVEHWVFFVEFQVEFCFLKEIVVIFQMYFFFKRKNVRF